MEGYLGEVGVFGEFFKAVGQCDGSCAVGAELQDGSMDGDDGVRQSQSCGVGDSQDTGGQGWRAGQGVGDGIGVVGWGFEQLEQRFGADIDLAELSKSSGEFFSVLRLIAWLRH